MATSTSSKKKVKMTGAQFFEIVGTKVGLKKNVVRDMVYAMGEVVVEQLTKTGEVRIPRFGRFFTKFYPAKKLAAGEYTNAFKKGPDGKALVEYREARVRPAKTKLKFLTASQIKKPVLTR